MLSVSYSALAVFQHRVSGTLQVSEGIVTLKNGYLNPSPLTKFLMQTTFL